MKKNSNSNKKFQIFTIILTAIVSSSLTMGYYFASSHIENKKALMLFNLNKQETYYNKKMVLLDEFSTLTSQLGLQMKETAWRCAYTDAKVSAIMEELNSSESNYDNIETFNYYIDQTEELYAKEDEYMKEYDKLIADFKSILLQINLYYDSIDDNSVNDLSSQLFKDFDIEIEKSKVKGNIKVINNKVIYSDTSSEIEVLENNQEFPLKSIKMATTMFYELKNIE